MTPADVLALVERLEKLGSMADPDVEWQMEIATTANDAAACIQSLAAARDAAEKARDEAVLEAALRRALAWSARIDGPPTRRW